MKSYFLSTGSSDGNGISLQLKSSFSGSADCNDVIMEVVSRTVPMSSSGAGHNVVPPRNSGMRDGSRLQPRPEVEARCCSTSLIPTPKKTG
jgi:hypothetical protein